MSPGHRERPSPGTGYGGPTAGRPVLGVVGDLVEDIVVWLNEPLRRGTDTDVDLRRQRGGSAANVAAFAAPRVPTRFLGCVGADAAGDAVVAELAGHGVDVRVQRRGATGTIVVLVDGSGERSMLPNRGASLLLSDVDEEWTRGLAHLHLTAYSLAADPAAATVVELVERMHRQGGSVSVDASSTGLLHGFGPRRFLDLVAELGPRFLLANRAESDALGLLTADRAGSGAAALPATTIVVKDGPHPTVVLPAGRAPFAVAPPPATVVRDLTGAGDAFAAGFLAAALHGAELRPACEAGHAVAATVLGAPGASSAVASGTPT